MKENVEKKKITDKLIGVYDYTVILTYISLFISVIGKIRRRERNERGQDKDLGRQLPVLHFRDFVICLTER